MALLKRLSDSFWCYISPRKTDNATLPTPPKTNPTSKNLPKPVGRTYTRNVPGGARSPISGGGEISSWRLTSPASQASTSVTSRKRRKLATPTSSDLRHHHKKRKMRSSEIEYEGSADLDGDTLMDEEYHDDSPLAFRYSSPGIRMTKSPSSGLGEDDSLSVDNTLVVSEGADTPARSRVISLPREHSMRGISTAELRAQGWDDDYIVLIQKIAMRGYESILPAYMKFEYNFLPDGLFEATDVAFVASTRNDHFKACKALGQLFELGGRVRDRMYMRGQIEPEIQIRRNIQAYLDWALDDAEIDRSTYIPVLAIETKPAGTDAVRLRTNATLKCRGLADRYRRALRAQPSVETSPGTRASDGALLAYPLPTFYAIVASHSIVAIMAYKPDAEAPECTSMAFFDFNDKNYDVWNSLALAMLVCHVRNVQMRIAEETSFGLRHIGYSDEEMEEDDPDA